MKKNTYIIINQKSNDDESYMGSSLSLCLFFIIMFILTYFFILKKDDPVDCTVSEWSNPSDCTKECGGGIETRTREVQVFPKNGGKPCPDLINYSTCNSQSC